MSHPKANLGEGGEFKPIQKKQEQSQPGLEKDMQPSSESTRLEGSDGFVEYQGADKLKGKSAFITGGDSGIGRSVAVLFAREGADRITIVYLPEEEVDAQDTKKMIEKEGGTCLLIAGNLMDNNTCKSAVENHIEKFGSLDILVNNASKQVLCDDITEIDLDNVESTFRSNIIQMFAITKFAVPHMKKGGSIINTASTVAFRGSGSVVDYAASKGAIVTFTKALAQQLGPKGIRVNSVAPGPVHTPIQVASRPGHQIEGFGKQSLLGRIGQPSEIAPSYIFLASKDATLYHGQVLHAYPIGD